MTNTINRVRRCAPVFLLLLALPVAVFARQAAGNRPTRLVLGFTGDPATSAAVTWRTMESVTTPLAQVAVATPDPGIEKTAASVPATTSPITLETGATVFHHQARFDGLKPATRYAYRVGDGQAWSEWMQFSTAGASVAPFRFLYLGDAQNGLNDQWPRAARGAFLQASDARFCLFAGDLLAEGYDDALWAQWHGGLAFLAGMVPIVAVPGNHDEHRAASSPDPKHVFGVSDLWRGHLSSPGNGPTLPGLEGQNWSFDYQGVRFIGLDANPFANEDYVESERDRVRQAELEWLERLLARNPNRWTVLALHQTIYSVAKDRDYPALRAALVPLIDRYHVDLVLQGHDHVYARSKKLAGGRVVRPSEPGAVYMVSVSGSKMYQESDAFGGLMEKVAARVQCFQVVSIDGGRLRVDAFTADGRRLDAFELRKTGSSGWATLLPPSR